MPIEDLTTRYYRLPVGQAADAGHGTITTEELILVTLRADGLTGTGYAYTIGRGGRAIQALLEEDLRPLLLGQEATDIDGLWERLWRALRYVGRGGLVAFAIAAVDIALWDLAGQQAGQPLYRLLGGHARPIPAYGSGVDLHKPLPALLAQVAHFLAQGFPGVKIKVGRPDPADDRARVAAVRSLIGDRVDLMLDANMAWTRAEALERGRLLAEFRPLWLEEPLAPEDVPGHAVLVASLPYHIAVGESLHAVAEFERYIGERAATVIQIDPITNGGITPVRRVLALADAAGLAISSHYADELAAHLLCASQRPLYLEKHAFALDPYLEEPQIVRDGHVWPSEAPGHGLRFDLARLAPYAG